MSIDTLYTIYRKCPHMMFRGTFSVQHTTFPVKVIPLYIPSRLKEKE
jgi:hypothetical protein